MPLSVGDRLGPYEIFALIGSGGMGEVYKARDIRLDRIVAVKVSKTEFSERFEREARVIATLNHPHICQLYDVGPNYLVMEYIEGTPLKGPLPLDQALKYGVQTCDALDAAHKKSITHRDLKPANILVTKAGVKLLDFGLAKLGPAVKADEATVTMALTGKGEILGTLLYMSPEQLQGKDADARSDIFAFGLVLYEMLTGKRAFDGSSQASVIAAILERPAPSVAEVAPATLDRVLRKCLAKDPDDRWQTARDLKDEMEWITSAPEPGPGRAAPSRSRIGRLTGLAAAVLMIALAGALWGWWRATRPVPHPLMNLNMDLGPDAVLAGRVTVILSPDGTRLVYRSRGGLSTRLLDQRKATPLAGTEGAADPFFSPDGQWIGFFANGKLKKISVQGGAAVTLCDAPSPHGGSWGEGGNIVFAPNPRGGLSRVSEAGGSAQPLTQLDQQKGETTHRFPQILPGGNSVLFTAAGTSNFEEATLEVASLKTGQRKTLQRGGFFGRYLPSEHLTYIHQGTLSAAPMDLDKLALTGPALPLLEDVAANAIEGAAQFDFSQSGAAVYVSGNAATTAWPIAWLDSTGKTQPLKATPAVYRNPSFSPDGKRLAFNLNNDDISIYDLQRDTISRLTFTPGVNNWPVWTPDGRGIVYQFRSGGAQNLYWIRSDGAAAAVRLTDSKNDQTPYSFSPDGKRLAFQEQGDTTLADIWTLPIDWSDPEHPKAGQPEVYLRTPSDEGTPAFSPDGRWIAYAGIEGSNREVFVRPFPADPSGGKWQISSGASSLPIWSRNGRELFYLAQNRIMVVSYTAKGATFVPDKPRLWSDHRIFSPGLGGGRIYDLAPDGKRFAVFEPPEGEQKPETHVNLLLNFFDEVRRRAPAGK